jgi:hypothetical protein
VYSSTLLRLGINFKFSAHALYPHLVTPLLFTGPIYVRYLHESLPFQRWWSFRGDILSKFFTLTGIRNYVLVRSLLSLLFQPEKCVIGPDHGRTCISCMHASYLSSRRLVNNTDGFSQPFVFRCWYDALNLTLDQFSHSSRLLKLTSITLGIHTTATARHPPPFDVLSS